MKIDAKIEWVIDDSQLGIKSGTTETVCVDCDYVDADYDEVVEWVENALAEKYGTGLYMSRSETDQKDFVIKNMDKLLEDLAFEEFQEKTDPGYEEC